jgi:hypothetical protein
MTGLRIALALLLLAGSAHAQQTQSTINPNVPPVGFLVEQSGPQFRDNFQRAINDINVLFNRPSSGALIAGTSTVTGSCTTGFNLFNNAGVLGCQANGAGGGLTVGTSTITSGVTQQLLYDNAGVLGEVTKANSSVLISSGAGVPSWATTLPAGLMLPSLIVTGSFTATGLVTNADLVNASTTVNGQTCTLGLTCTISASAGTITPGTTAVASGVTNQLLYDNGGLLGEVTKGNNCLYGTNGTGVPSCQTTLPASLTAPTFIVTGSFTATGLVTLADIATQTNNTVLGNATAGVAGPTAISIGSCSTAASALNWTTNTGFGCNTSITAAAMPASGLTGQVAVANGGTGLASGTSGGVLAYTASGTLASSAALGANCVVFGGGAGVVPATSSSTCPTVSSTGLVTIPNTTVTSVAGGGGALVVTGGILGASPLNVFGSTAALANLAILGSASGTGGGAQFQVYNGSSTIIIEVGNRSSMTGGAYDATPIFYATGALNFYSSTLTSANYSAIITTFATAASNATTGTFQVQGGMAASATSFFPSMILPVSTGTPVASLCLDASNNVIKKTTPGSCV